MFLGRLLNTSTAFRGDGSERYIYEEVRLWGNLMQISAIGKHLSGSGKLASPIHVRDEGEEYQIFMFPPRSTV